MESMVISGKNQAVIAARVRAKLGVRSGDTLIIDRVTDKEVVLKTEPSYYDLIDTVPTREEAPVKRIRTLRDNWK